jgi:hypothetical protein
MASERTGLHTLVTFTLRATNPIRIRVGSRLGNEKMRVQTGALPHRIWTSSELPEKPREDARCENHCPPDSTEHVWHGGVHHT